MTDDPGLRSTKGAEQRWLQALKRRCAAQSLTPPSRSAISRRLQGIGERELARRRKGPGAPEP